ncbi:hypothetical protein [Streptacidiphilus melanogenes]|uniref:hypothetical protein n=1 Tax=Streptacidiphilus melanogenes TaxID=411235 RepID=UPI0005A67AAC|nr:hypothetical protein [Streptacidiphilus melanogenes]
MTRKQVSAAAEKAGALERLRAWASGSDEDQAIINEIEQCHEEWLRIAVLMAVGRLAIYQLESDPVAVLHIMATGGRRRPTGGAPVRGYRAAPKAPSAACWQ